MSINQRADRFAGMKNLAKQMGILATTDLQNVSISFAGHCLAARIIIFDQPVHE
jgi:hypothetical protein|tara:strand:- start:1742 stop:1903 length:162 start_codon:yes stop_codon:yes gene_type:complete